jgi:hypothetical protein
MKASFANGARNSVVAFLDATIVLTGGARETSRHERLSALKFTAPAGLPWPDQMARVRLCFSPSHNG